jgi:hypothetical protein
MAQNIPATWPMILLAVSMAISPATTLQALPEGQDVGARQRRHRPIAADRLDERGKRRLLRRAPPLPLALRLADKGRLGKTLQLVHHLRQHDRGHVLAAQDCGDLDGLLDVLPSSRSKRSTIRSTGDTASPAAGV